MDQSDLQYRSCRHRVGMTCRRAGIIVMLVCLCPSLQLAEDAEEDVETSESAEAPLALRVFFLPGDYRDHCEGGMMHGDMIVVTVGFKNQSGATMPLKVPMYPHGDMLTFELRTAAGLLIPQAQWQGPPPDSETFSLWPGREEQIEYTLSPWLYPLSLEPGKYVLSIKYKDGDLSAQASDFEFPVVAETEVDEDGLPIETDLDDYIALMKIAGTAQFVEAVRADPSYSFGGEPPLPVLFELISTLRGLGRYDEAISECWNVIRQCRYIGRDEQYILRWTIAECHHAKGDIDRAIKELLKLPGLEARKLALEWGWKEPKIPHQPPETPPSAEVTGGITEVPRSHEPGHSSELEANSVPAAESRGHRLPREERSTPSGAATTPNSISAYLALALALLAGIAAGAGIAFLVRRTR